MKNELKVSRFVLVCALCLGSYASYGASSVRALGGSGTYTSASSASSASSGATAVRGGSMRVTPTANKGGSSTTTGSVGTTVRTPRLSIGNYLGGGTSISGGSSLRPQQPGGGSSSSGGGSIDPDLGEQLQQDIDDIRGELDDLHAKDDELTGNLDDKQGILTPDGIIDIDEKNNIFINIDELEKQLDLVAGQDGREVEIGRNETHLLWRYVGDATWKDLIAIEELRGPQGEPGEPGTPADMSNYYTKEEMELALNQAIQNAGHVTKEELATVATTGSYNDLKDKPNIPEGVVVDSELTDGGVNAVQGGVIKAAIDKKADQTAVDALEGRVDTVESGVANAELTASAAKEAADGVKNDLATKEDKSNKVGSAGFDAAAGDDTKYPSVKAVADKLANYATTEDLAGKADKGTTLAEYGITDAYTKAETYDQATIDEKIAEISSGGEIDLSGYAKTDYVNTELGKKEDKANIVQTIRSSLEAEETKYTSEKAVATALEGKADSSALDNLATKDEIANLATKEELETKADVVDLDAYAKKGEIKDADIAPDAAISRSKLAQDVQTALDTAEKAVSIEGAGSNKVLGTDENGDKVWYEIAL